MPEMQFCNHGGAGPEYSTLRIAFPLKSSYLTFYASNPQHTIDIVLTAGDVSVLVATLQKYGYVPGSAKEEQPLSEKEGRIVPSPALLELLRDLKGSLTDLLEDNWPVDEQLEKIRHQLILLEGKTKVEDIQQKSDVKDALPAYDVIVEGEALAFREELQRRNARLPFVLNHDAIARMMQAFPPDAQEEGVPDVDADINEEDEEDDGN